MTTQSKWKVALGVSGGIAAYKAVEVLRGLQRAGCEVRVGMTKRACEFIQPLTFRSLSGSHVIVDDYAADNPDPIAHITYSQSVDLFLVAPATANIIAKFANGVADDFVTSTYLACTSPVIIAPAMNSRMLEHPATQRNLRQLRSDGVTIVEPDAGEMACGTIGPGRLSDPERIVQAAIELLQNKSSSDLSGERILITTGATREAIDPVRFLSNRSSGRMGYALARAALRRGAEVTAVAGPTTVPPPPGVNLLQVSSAEEMRNAVSSHLAHATIFIGAAAVADYRPVVQADQKIKKSNEHLTLELERTPDILGEVAKNRNSGTLVIGFAAETENVAVHAKHKLETKALDAIVANDVSRTDAGFESEYNAVTILLRGGTSVDVPRSDKETIADRVLDAIVSLRRKQNSKPHTAT